MKCWVLTSRCLRTKFCMYFILIICIFILGHLFQTRRAAALRSIFHHFPYSRGNNLLFHQTHLDNSTPFIPGLFLKNIQPKNESFCNFRLGSDFFEVQDFEVDVSPQLGYDGTYRIIYNVIQGSNKNESRTVTYCSHFTPEFIYYLVEIVIRWEGPVSVSAFVPSTDASLTLCLLERLCHCVPEMTKVSLHFVFPTEYPPDYISCDPMLSVPQGCFMPDVLVNKKLKTFRNAESLTYPVNVARNVARVSAKTTYILVSDIELIPSKNLVSRFLTMILRLEERSGTDFRLILKRFVYVLPVFEVEHNVNIPDIKSQLIDLYSQNKAIYFHRWVCLHCQRFPGLQRWIHRKLHSMDNTVQPLLVVRREFPYHRWEPIYIGTNQEPLYSEQLSWEGQQDKMTQMHEMCLIGYKFVILDGAFLVHAPGIKRKSNTIKPVDAHNVHLYQNMHYYDDIIRKVTKLHGAKQQCKIH